jgi:ankyrin repeat protein
LVLKGAITNSSVVQSLNESLRYGVIDGDVEKASAALAKGADPNLCAQSVGLVLIGATKAKNLDLVKLLLKYRANPNQHDAFGATALFYAAGNGSAAIAKALIEAGAKVNARARGQGQYGITPLMAAAESGRYEVAKMLLDCGADPNAKDDKGRTAMDFARRAKRLDIQALLAKAGASGQ